MNRFRILLFSIVAIGVVIFASRHRSLKQLHTEQARLRERTHERLNGAATTPAVTAAIDSTNSSLTETERLELLRLRGQVGQLHGELRQETNSAANRSGAQATPTPVRDLPGYVSMHAARDVGAASGGELLQTMFWAMRASATNRLLEICDLNGEGAREQMEKMIRQMARSQAHDWAGKMNQFGFRVIREVPLEGGDAAVVFEPVNSDGSSPRRLATRIRRVGSEWRIVMGKNGPEGVQLSNELLND